MFLDVTKKQTMYSYDNQSKRLLRQPIACYEIAKRTYDKYDLCYADPRK